MVCGLLMTGVAVAFIGLPCLALLFNVDPSEMVAALGRQWAREALVLSLKTSLVATALCAVIGSPVAYLLARVDLLGKRAIEGLLQLPLVLPPVVAGVALLMAFGRRGLLGKALMAGGIEIPFTTVAVVMAQTFVAFPLYVQAARAGFQLVPRSVEEASRTLGAGSFRTFARITVPLSWPALLSGVVLCWGRAVGEFGATMVFAGNMRGTTRTMPLAILTALQSDVDAAVVLAVMLLIVSAVVFIGARWILGEIGQVQ
jgi:molybdate transport system permease protein